MLTRRHRTIAHALEQGTLLPFLYNTKTIARQYATRPDLIDEALDSGPQDSPGYSQRERHQSRRTFEHRGQPRPRNSEPFREWVEHVPFEGAGGPKAADADFEGSTVTPRERKAFEELFKLKKKRQDGQGKVAVGAGKKNAKSLNSSKNKAQSLDDIMDAAGDEAEDDLSAQSKAYPKGLGRMAREAQEQRRRDSKPSQSDAIAAAAKKDIQTVRKLLDNAKTDVEVWDVLQQKVFKRVIALNLDGTETKTSKKARKKQAAEDDTSTAPLGTPTKNTSKTKQQPTQTFTDLDILTQTLPQHLTTTHSTLTTSFPGSALPSTLLPYLRTLGPAAFALGTSTHLYNQHMRELYYRSTDLDAITDTLREMDEQVYMYDEFTEVLVAKVLAHARLAGEGVWGDGVRRWWEGEGMRMRLGRLARMGKVVRGRREEEALRRARLEQETEEGMEEGGGGR